jgi:hypothetical protein
MGFPPSGQVVKVIADSAPQINTAEFAPGQLPAPALVKTYHDT